MPDQDHIVTRGLLVAACITCTGVGVLLGVLFCMPLVPYEIPESSAALLGAALGSLVTVGAAAWLATHKERHARAEAVAFIRREMGLFQLEYAQALEAAAHAVDLDQNRLNEAHVRLMALWSRIGPTLEILEMLKPVFASVGPHGLVCHWGIVQALTAAEGSLHALSANGIALFAAHDETLLGAKAKIDIHLAKL